jgi:SAM-dependent methyltransferase
MTLGAALYAFNIGRYGIYRGQQRFYAIAQETGISSDAARALLASPPSRLFIDFANLEKSRERDRITPMAATTYADDTLAGYADADYSKSPGPLREQQRGLILVRVEAAAAELPDGATIVEIGTGNGDVAAFVARRFPNLKVVGVDLSVAVADSKHQLENLRFVGGYALDLLEGRQLDGDLCFASSTFVVFAPRELARYATALRDRGYAHVILSEPTWGPYEPTASGSPLSRHLEGDVWHHTYDAYLRAAGFEISAVEAKPYTHAVSPRPDILLVQVEAQVAP